jgi:beta subunit of N-acylethanolamine-hydrolyzing acid amidase
MTAPLKVYSSPIYDIDLEEPPDLRWRKFCKAEGDNIQKILSDMHQCVDENLLGMLSPAMRGFVKTLGGTTGWLAHTVANLYGEEYTAEIRGIAKYAEVPIGELMLGNLIYDMTSLSEMYGCGCSSASWDINNTPVLVRNMDWVVPQSTGKYTRLIRFHRRSNSYISVGVIGCVGVVSAICSQWAVTVNQAPIVKKFNSWVNYFIPSDLFRWPVLQRVRAVCDRMADYNNTVIGLRTQQTMVPFFAHVVGREANEHSIVAHTGDETFLRTAGKKKAKLVQTNHYITPRLKKHNPENGEDYVWDTYGRYDVLKERVDTQLPQTAGEALSLLKGSDVTTADTMQQMLLWPAQETMVLKTRNG